jgi:hypothetical protein
MPARSLRGALAAFLGLAPLAAMAQTPPGQAQIYDPQPPPDSAYIRFVNTLGEELALRPSFLPAQRLGTKPEERISVYHVAQRVGGNQEFSVEATAGRRTGRVALNMRPGTFNTVLLQPQGDGGIAATPIVDEADFNRARSRLSFYNAANCPAASVSLAPSGPAVLEGVASNAAKARSVNPVTAELRAECTGGQAAPIFPLQGLEAGGMYSIWLMRPDGRTLTAFFTRDTTARWRN